MLQIFAVFPGSGIKVVTFTSFANCSIIFNREKVFNIKNGQEKSNWKLLHSCFFTNTNYLC